MSRSIENMTDRELLEEIYERQEEDRKLLKGMRNRIRFQNFLGIMKWIIYIAIAVGLYTYLQPFFDSILDTYKSLQDSAQTVAEIKAKFPAFPF